MSVDIPRLGDTQLRTSRSKTCLQGQASRRSSGTLSRQNSFGRLDKTPSSRNSNVPEIKPLDYHTANTILAAFADHVEMELTKEEDHSRKQYTLTNDDLDNYNFNGDAEKKYTKRRHQEDQELSQIHALKEYHRKDAIQTDFAYIHGHVEDEHSHGDDHVDKTYTPKYNHTKYKYTHRDDRIEKKYAHGDYHLEKGNTYTHEENDHARIDDHPKKNRNNQHVEKKCRQRDDHMNQEHASAVTNQPGISISTFGILDQKKRQFPERLEKTFQNKRIAIISDDHRIAITSKVADEIKQELAAKKEMNPELAGLRGEEVDENGNQSFPVAYRLSPNKAKKQSLGSNKKPDNSPNNRKGAPDNKGSSGKGLLFGVDNVINGKEVSPRTDKATNDKELPSGIDKAEHGKELFHGEDKAANGKDLPHGKDKKAKGNKLPSGVDVDINNHYLAIVPASDIDVAHDKRDLVYGPFYFVKKTEVEKCGSSSETPTNSGGNNLAGNVKSATAKSHVKYLAEAHGSMLPNTRQNYLAETYKSVLPNSKDNHFAEAHKSDTIKGRVTHLTEAGDLKHLDTNKSRSISQNEPEPIIKQSVRGSPQRSNVRCAFSPKQQLKGRKRGKRKKQRSPEVDYQPVSRETSACCLPVVDQLKPEEPSPVDPNKADVIGSKPFLDLDLRESNSPRNYTNLREYNKPTKYEDHLEDSHLKYAGLLEHNNTTKYAGDLLEDNKSTKYKGDLLEDNSPMKYMKANVEFLIGVGVNEVKVKGARHVR